MAKRRQLRYLDQHSSMTLREGIIELREAEGADGDAVENVAPELVPDLHMHDAIHVLFGCPTNLSGEISAHLWTLFGTTLRLRDMHRVNMHRDHRQVLARIGYVKLIRMWFKNIPTMIATILRSFRMSQKWPAASYDEYLDVPLIELRQQFNIRCPKRFHKTDSEGSAGAALRHARASRIVTQ